MVDETLPLMKEVDWFAAAAYVNRQPDQLSNLELYNKLFKLSPFTTRKRICRPW